MRVGREERGGGEVGEEERGEAPEESWTVRMGVE